MKRLLLPLSAALAFWTGAVQAEDIRLQALVSAGATITSTAVPGGGQYALVCSAESHYRVCERSTGCAAVVTDMTVAANVPFDLCLAGTSNVGRFVAIIPTTGSATCQLYRVAPKTSVCGL